MVGGQDFNFKMKSLVFMKANKSQSISINYLTVRRVDNCREEFSKLSQVSESNRKFVNIENLKFKIN